MTYNPFDWRNNPKRIDMTDVNTAKKSSYQQTAVINKKRAQGVEPVSIHLPGSRDDIPSRFVANMPEMPKYDQNAARREQRRLAREAKK